jgi:hypothetical protein
MSPLSDIGFTLSHLLQVARQGKISAQETQDSIQFFAFDLKRNGKAQTLNGSPLNFFMGILRKGVPYAPPENYESPAEEARRKIHEFKARREQERLAHEQQLKDLEFGEWRRGVTPDQAMNLVPDAVKDLPRAREASLRLHFDEQVWPELEAAYLGLPSQDAPERAQIRATIAEALGEGPQP